MIHLIGTWLYFSGRSLDRPITVAEVMVRYIGDAAATWMALAGATIPGIISVSGQTATRILKHYLARHPEMADSAIGKMLAWYEGGGETEMGL